MIFKSGTWLSSKGDVRGAGIAMGLKRYQR